MNMIPSKSSVLALVGAALLMTACSGLKQTSSSSGGGTTGSYTIGGSVTGLTGTGLVLSDNKTDTLAITPGTNGASVPFTFKNQVTGAYDVEVQTQPTGQTCKATNNTGTATANVTTVTVACTNNSVTATIGGTLSGLATGGSVILQDNGGDSLTLTANGPFTFKTPVTGPTDAYAVTVDTQPATPNQICTVASGSGIASANVTNVTVTCVLSYTIGGTITGLVGTGMVLENSSDQELLTIKPGSGNQAFTFVNYVPTGTKYTVSISTQPSNPGQTCVVTPGTASGTATANVTSVVVTCPAVTYSVGGTTVGLAGVQPNNGAVADGTFILQNVLGNTLAVTQNGPFTFATPEALNDQYEISILHSASTQPQGCTLWDYKGVVTSNVTSIVADCAHNDWTWIDGTNTAGTIAHPQYGNFPTSAPTTIPNPYTNTPGARYSGAGWTDKFGNLVLFGGDGWELSGNSQPDTLDAPMNDMWVCVMDPASPDECQWQLVGAYNTTANGQTGSTTTYGAGIILNAQHEGQLGIYINVGNSVPYPTPVPGGRYGSATWTDTAGNLWLFGGGSPGKHFLNDLWKYDMSGYDGTTNKYTTVIGQWTYVNGSSAVDQPGTYTGAVGTLVPGARVNPVFWTDLSGNFWLFGGYGWDGSANLGYLNDLWKFDGTNWTWVSGGSTNKANQDGIYGTAGTPASTNMPGGRQEAVGWVDASGNLWLFGGEGEDSVGTANGILNDLWIYNISSNQWTYVMGSTKANQTGIYESSPAVGPVSTIGAAGTCGLTVGNAPLNCGSVSTTGALPGSRWGASAWTDLGGNLWLFGGWGLDSTATNGNGALNDLWVYTPNATAGQPGTWVWAKGSNTGSDNGNYGSLLRPYETYYIFTPGGRSNATYWIDKLPTYTLPADFSHENIQLWMFGGEGYDSTSTTGNGYLNDLWRYLPYQD
jgi:Galactose oxidase, central domain/Kelch motif